MIIVPDIRLATAADAQGIAELSRDYIEQGLGWSWRQGRVLRAIRDPATNVAVVGGRSGVLGFGIMQYGDRKAHLTLLGVASAQRKRGLASRILAWLERCADTAGIERILVEARIDNPGAIAFYEKQGYSTVARAAGYYRGVIDAVRLEKRLWVQTDA